MLTFFVIVNREDVSKKIGWEECSRHRCLGKDRFEPKKLRMWLAHMTSYSAVHFINISNYFS